MFAVRPAYRRLLVLLGLGLLATWSNAAELTFTVKEQLNLSWTGQLLSYPISPEKGTCHPGAIGLLGPAGPLPCQLSEIETWEGTPHVKRALVSFVVAELPPLAQQVYKLSYGPVPVPGAAQPGVGIVAGQQVTLRGAADFAVRLPLGEATFAEPKPLSELPGPLAGIQGAGDSWVGSSAFAGEGQALGWSGKVIENGPVFARVRYSYRFTGEQTLTLDARVIAGDRVVQWTVSPSADTPALALRYTLPAAGASKAATPKGYGQWAKADRTLTLTPKPEPFAWLSPNSSLVNIWADNPSELRMAGTDGREWRLRTQQPGRWAQPTPLTYGGQKQWRLDKVERMWETWQRHRLPLVYDGQSLVISVPLTKASRPWTMGHGAPTIDERLQEVNGMVLDWPAKAGDPHPRLFVSEPEFKAAWARIADDPEWAKALPAKADGKLLAAISRYVLGGSAAQVRYAPPERVGPGAQEAMIENLRQMLAMLGNYDVMRGAINTIGVYDVMMDAPFMSATDRQLFRAQAAYLAYLMADPMCWSQERGMCSGNPNMSVSYTLSLGIIACALRDHPMAKTWTDHATAWMNVWLDDEVGANGEWLPEGAHYSIVSLEPMISYAIAAQRAGFHDFSGDPRLKKMILYFAKTHGPPDPQRGNRRVSAAHGRGTAGEIQGHFGLAAKFYAASDPALSAQLQFVWLGMGAPSNIGDTRFGGIQQYYLDARLPAEQPDWRSELFPGLGALWRHGYGQSTENYLLLLSHVDSYRNLDVWAPEIGGIAEWYAIGKPISRFFTFKHSYHEHHQLLTNGVRLTHPWGAPGEIKKPFGYYPSTTPEAYASQPLMDYVRSTFVIQKVDDRDWFPEKMPPYPAEAPNTAAKLNWTRQALYLKDEAEDGPTALFLRDSTSGGQPTVWQFWTLSEKLGTPAEVANLEAFLKDKPGNAILPARALPPGDRYTAIGQFGVDLEYFIASPKDGPRHTLRYGGELNRRPEYQDLLHLQQPGDGSYVVALVPRTREQAAPKFTSLADGKLLKLVREPGTDFVFLAEKDTKASGEGVAVFGTAATVCVRPTVTTLHLAAAGELSYQGHGLAGASAAALEIQAAWLRVFLPPASPGGHFMLLCPVTPTLDDPPAGVTLTRAGDAWQLIIPANTREVSLKLPAK